MFDFFKKRILTAPKKTKKGTRDEFKKSFFSDRNHQWINEDKITKRSIEILLDTFSDEHIAFFNKHETYLLPCQAHLSCAIGKTGNHHLILIFPELIQLLKSGSTFQGVAILAHEFGHIYHQHTEQRIDTLQAQIEADRFAFDLGFGEELQEVLLDHVYSVDCRVRISRLTTDLLGLKK